MIGPERTLIMCILLGIQLTGIVGAVMTRFSAGSRRELTCQRLFWGCLCLVGMTTMVAAELWPECWPTLATTFSVMVLIVTVDFRRSGRVAAQPAFLTSFAAPESMDPGTASGG